MKEKRNLGTYMRLCPQCKAVAVFRNCPEDTKLYCDAGHYLGRSPTAEEYEAMMAGEYA